MFSIKFGGECVKVYDGDTIEVEVRKTLRLRLLDLWCPEIRTSDPEEKRRGLEARDALRGLIEGRDVVFEIGIEETAKFGGSMSFGRILAHVTIDGIDVSEWMRDNGFGTLTKEG